MQNNFPEIFLYLAKKSREISIVLDTIINSRMTESERLELTKAEALSSEMNRRLISLSDYYSSKRQAEEDNK